MSHTRKAARATPASLALSRAIASAAALISVPMPKALGNSLRSASRIAPQPVPRSAMRQERDRGPCLSSAASAASTTVSVSGRGTSVASLTRSRSVQNSLVPVIRATGSSPSRRRASAAIALCCCGVSTCPARAASAAWSRPSAWPTSTRASSSAVSMPAARNSVAQARRKSATVRFLPAAGATACRMFIGSEFKRTPPSSSRLKHPAPQVAPLGSRPPARR